MRKIILSLGLAWTIMSGAAQPKSDWSKGEIILSNGERLEGRMVYASNVESVSILTETGMQKTYNGSQLHSFHFLDSRQQIIRSFKKSVLPDEGREAVVEVVVDGDLQVLRCLKPKHRRHNSEKAILNYFPAEPYDHGRFQYFVHDGLYLQTLDRFLHRNYTSKTRRWHKHLEQFRCRNYLDNGIASWLKILFYYNVLENEYKSRRVLPDLPDSTQQIVSHYF